ncbi:hypothetical protein F4778DRAFT_241107 [Xylariomycetidae sp. FL2044]|nr:hypothetical protein F4778DRAFT_241107 [Xylariomycetidae sp. FL2044]
MPSMAAFDYYEELEIGRDATIQEIKASYRRLSLLHHPDKNVHDVEGATARFQRIQESYETLSNPARRDHYDNPPSRFRSAHQYYPEPDDDDDYYFTSEDDDEYEYYRNGPYYGNTFFDFFDMRGAGAWQQHHHYRPTGYEEMERMWAEEERRAEEETKRYMEQMAKIREIREQREREARERRDKKRADQAAVENRARMETEMKASAEREEQMNRWHDHSAVSFDEKRAACLHTAYMWEKDNQERKKVKCQNCPAKCKISFVCPYCDLSVCQKCRDNLAERRRKYVERPAEDPVPDAANEISEDSAEAAKDESVKTQKNKKQSKGNPKKNSAESQPESKKRPNAETARATPANSAPVKATQPKATPVEATPAKGPSAKAMPSAKPKLETPKQHKKSTRPDVQACAPHTDHHSGGKKSGPRQSTSPAPADTQQSNRHPTPSPKSNGTSGSGGRTTPTTANEPRTRNSKPCSFFAQGRCKKGDQCNFSHESNKGDQPRAAPILCNICKKPGHRAKTCWHRARGSGEKLGAPAGAAGVKSPA